MFSLYYGVIILKEMYAPQTTEERDSYLFRDVFELHLLKAFVFNEVIVGAIIILQLI
jgi:hypothetical protein